MSCTGSFKNPPKLEDDSLYEQWKSDVDVWSKLTDLATTKQALAVHLTLSGRARQASSEVDVTELEKETGLTTLLTKLDGVYLADKGRRQFSAFHGLYDCRRSPDVKVTQFISEFEHLYHKFSKLDMTLPDSVQAFMLLAACNFSDNDRQLVMSAITDVTYSNMKDAIKRVFGSVMTNKNEQKVKEEPVFHAESSENVESEVFFSNRARPLQRGGGSVGARRRSGRFGTSASTRGRKYVNERKMNPIGKDGYVSRCAICESIYHWVRDCPDNEKDNSTKDKLSDVENDGEQVHLSLFMGNSNGAKNGKLRNLLSESNGYAILDTGCSSTVCGNTWFDNYVSELSEYDRSKILEEKSSNNFTFGDGVSVQSSKQVTVPCYLGGIRSTITTDVVEYEIPLLLSNKSMRKANMCLDFQTDSVKIGQIIVNLSTSTSGHYLLPLTF